MRAIESAQEAASLAGIAVSRETTERLTLYVDLLRRWNPSKNLVAASTLDAVWTRHIADSLQIVAQAPQALVWADLGSGGGLPALVVAATLAGRDGALVHCVESKQGKAAFLQEAARQMRVPVRVWPRRIEDVVGHDIVTADVVSARALAPLSDLLRLSTPLLKTGAVGLFPKGQDVGSELTQASKYWRFNYRSVPSVTDPRGSILVVRDVSPAAD